MQDNRHESGFVAGTPVWTDRGLMPIEQIKVGDFILSKPGDGRGERGYKRVIKTQIFENKIIDVVEYAFPDGKEPQNLDFNFLFAASYHPVWIKDIFKGKLTGWKPAYNLLYGEELELATDAFAYVWDRIYLLPTENPNIGWVSYHDDSSKDFCVEFGLEGRFRHLKTLGHEISNGCLSRRAHNLEVEDFHTFYVSDEGVWVHDASPPVSQAGA